MKKKFKDRAKNSVKSISQGEEVALTYRAKSQTTLISLRSKKLERGKESTLFGIWANRSDFGSVDLFVRAMRRWRFS